MVRTKVHDNYEIIGPTQREFREDRSTTNLIEEISDLINEFLDNGGFVLVFLNLKSYSKPFIVRE